MKLCICFLFLISCGTMSNQSMTYKEKKAFSSCKLNLKTLKNKLERAGFLVQINKKNYIQTDFIHISELKELLKVDPTHSHYVQISAKNKRGHTSWHYVLSFDEMGTSLIGTDTPFKAMVNNYWMLVQQSIRNFVCK